jgi:hypothetical protein
MPRRPAASLLFSCSFFFYNLIHTFQGQDFFCCTPPPCIALCKS